LSSAPRERPPKIAVPRIARDVPAWLAGLLAGRRRRLEARERQEAEDDAEEEGGEVGAAGHGERAARHRLAARRVVGEEPDEDHEPDQQDERHRDALDDEQRAGDAAHGRDGEQVDADEHERGDDEGRPVGRAVPDADALEEAEKMRPAAIDVTTP
jgi:hypothetical protein